MNDICHLHSSLKIYISLKSNTGGGIIALGVVDGWPGVPILHHLHSGQGLHHQVEVEGSIYDRFCHQSIPALVTPDLGRGRGDRGEEGEVHVITASCGKLCIRFLKI